VSGEGRLGLEGLDDFGGGSLLEFAQFQSERCFLHLKERVSKLSLRHFVLVGLGGGSRSFLSLGAGVSLGSSVSLGLGLSMS
jgi:hypothetical protein